MGALQAYELESVLRRGGKGQSRGRHGLLWSVEFEGCDRHVRVAGNNSSELLSRLWENRLANVKKLDPPPSQRYLDQFQLVEAIVSVTPVSRTFQLRDENWTRYTVRCGGCVVSTVAVSVDQLRANLYWGRTSLPFVPARSGVNWYDFDFEIITAEPVGSWHEPPTPPPPVATSQRIFHDRVCPTCESINGPRSQRCHECHSRLDMPTKELLRITPA